MDIVRNFGLYVFLSLEEYFFFFLEKRLEENMMVKHPFNY